MIILAFLLLILIIVLRGGRIAELVVSGAVVTAAPVQAASKDSQIATYFNNLQAVGLVTKALCRLSGHGA